MTASNQNGLSRILDETFGEVSSAPLRCSRCNGRAIIEPESSLDNRTRKVLRCLECDFVEYFNTQNSQTLAKEKAKEKPSKK